MPAWAALLGMALATSSACAPASQYHASRSLRGALVRADTTFIGTRGRYRMYRVRLTSSTGLVATGRLLSPAGVLGSQPGVLLNDGRELNSAAVEFLPCEFGDVVVLSLD